MYYFLLLLGNLYLANYSVTLLQVLSANISFAELAYPSLYRDYFKLQILVL